MVNYKGPSDDFKTPTKWWLWAVGMTLLTVFIAGTCNFITKPLQVLDRVTDPDHIINSYEEFEEMHSTAISICQQISILEESASESVGGFSKEERLIGLKNQLTRWVNEYNAKSKMITRNNWKSSDLPYSITTKSICEL